MKKVIALITVLILSLSLVACSNSNESGTSADDGTDDAETHSFVLLVAALGDIGYLDNTWDGVQALCADYGYECKAIEMGTDTSVYEAAFQDALDSGLYDCFVMNADSVLTDFLAEHAEEYPDFLFFVNDVGRDYQCPSENVLGLSYLQNEGTYIGGALAAMMSKTGKIGIYLHTDNPVLNDFATGFYQGASDVNPDIKIYTAYGAGISGDSARAAELTKLMFNNGADFVFGCAGSSNGGLFQNVYDLGGFDAGYYAMGVDYDQYNMYLTTGASDLAEVILSSVVKNAGNSLHEAWKQLESGEIKGGSTVFFGINEGAVGLAMNDYYKANVPEDIQAKITDIDSKVKDGSIEVKSYFDFADHDEFLDYQAQFAA